MAGVQKTQWKMARQNRVDKYINNRHGIKKAKVWDE